MGSRVMYVVHVIGCEYVPELWSAMGLLFIPQFVYAYGALVE
jgi:hypothetical protein